ncbi:hypothetical protein DYB36_009719 [Aphanomyces astaci]|uniref:Uncharacterized protein n=1 Tax=Aphanomyces astaci TaxID=112090 RepID=A0A397BBV6_APHAT|nr:hypothetical protein DYB36_009719 [Aphanomyces astaci]
MKGRVLTRWLGCKVHTATWITYFAMAFKNIQARTRDERKAVRDKETWEKDRLRARKEGYIRVDTSISGSAMTVQAAGSQGYMSDADRFHTDVAGEEKVVRESRIAKHQMSYDTRRRDNQVREDQRWKAMDEKATEEKKRWDHLRDDGGKARRNKSSCQFNPITLKYNDGKDGERLKQADTEIRHRASVRAANLQFNSSRGGINPITGDPIKRVDGSAESKTQDNDDTTEAKNAEKVADQSAAKLDVQSLPIRAYLDQTVVPILLQGIEQSEKKIVVLFMPCRLDTRVHRGSSPDRRDCFHHVHLGHDLRRVRGRRRPLDHGRLHLVLDHHLHRDPGHLRHGRGRLHLDRDLRRRLCCRRRLDRPGPDREENFDLRWLYHSTA